jgi:hypothetical protein
MKTSSINIKAVIFLFIWGILQGCNNYKNEMINAGNEVISRLENFREDTGKLPDNLIEIGVDSSLLEIICYSKTDSMNYIVWFGTNVGESMKYDSNTKKWKKSN